MLPDLIADKYVNIENISIPRQSKGITNLCIYPTVIATKKIKIEAFNKR